MMTIGNLDGQFSASSAATGPATPPIVAVPAVLESHDRSPAAAVHHQPNTRRHPRLFPLHLAPIDAFFLMDDSQTYPMSSVIQLDFSGKLEPTAFHESLGVAIDRHPLLNAVVQPAKRNQPCWVPYAGGLPSVAWSNDRTEQPVPENEYLDLTREPGVRFWVHVAGGASRMTLQVHHACTDGTGVYRFIGDFLAAYAGRTSRSGVPVELQRLDPQHLRRRRRKMGRVAFEASRWECTRHALAEAWNIFGQAAQPLAPPTASADGMPPPAFAGLCAADLSAAEHQALRQVAARRGATVNDLLLAQMFRAASEWNSTHGARRSRAGLRIMMPFDMRDQHDYAMPAANMTAYTFLTRQPKQCSPWEDLLDGIHHETARMKQGHHGTDFIDAVMIADRVPWILPRLLRLNRCMATVTLSNVGDPTKRFLSALPRDRGRIVSGNVTLEDISGVPPLRWKMRSSLAVFSYLRKLKICMRCDPYRFPVSATQQFLGTYVRGLRALLPPQQQRRIA